MRTEPEKDLGLLTPDAAGHRLGRGQAGMFSLVPLSAQHTRKQGADVKILRIPENSEGGKKSDRKSTRLNSSHTTVSRMPSSA